MLRVATRRLLSLRSRLYEPRLSDGPKKMLFKTISASVYGIDAYLVEVEVDIGSARMLDFNVVGLPDNAVKKSRERIKSALRNCGFEFPYEQGVTINLARADVRKEGSGFDLPMALGLADAWANSLASRWTNACFWANCPWTAEFGQYAARFLLRLRPAIKDSKPSLSRKRMLAKQL